MAQSAVKAVKDEVKAKAKKQPPVSKEEQEKRLNICKECEFFTPNIKDLPERHRKQERCIKCGCFMKFKAKLRSQSCPIGKW
jgi:hypothetical protein